MVKESKCSSCKKREALSVSDAAADIEYVNSEFSLVVSSKSIKHSKDVFNELFDKVTKSENKPRRTYIG